jgi:cytidylate kinase
VERWAADEKTISIFTAEEVLELAVKGDMLIRGWGATMILRPVAHVPSIRVCAPLELRVKRLMERLETDDEALARHEIEVDDHARQSRMSEHFNVTWGDPALYDLTLNTERIPVAQCVDQIVALTRSAAFQETPESRRHLEDLAVQARARGALKADPRTAGIDILVEAQGGNVVLRGIVMDEGERSLCADIVQALAGVKGVDNQLRTMTGGLYRFPSQRKGFPER